MSWVPLPWCTSQSRMATRPAPRERACPAATAAWLSRQNPIPVALPAWWPGGRAMEKAGSPGGQGFQVVQVSGGVNCGEDVLLRGATGTPLHRRAVPLRARGPGERRREPLRVLHAGQEVDVPLRGGIGVDAQAPLPTVVSFETRSVFIIVVPPRSRQADVSNALNARRPGGVPYRPGSPRSPGPHGRR